MIFVAVQVNPGLTLAVKPLIRRHRIPILGLKMGPTSGSHMEFRQKPNCLNIGVCTGRESEGYHILMRAQHVCDDLWGFRIGF